MIPPSVSLPLALHALTYLVPSTQAAYTLQDDYSPNNFFDMFDFFTGADPTNGYVNYIDETDAQVLGLVSTNNNQVYMGVDYSTIAQAPGRSSVRIASKNTYNHGLIILDLEHMPGGICGTWPAFWLLGPNWPDSGEVDIIENVNSATTNQMTLHTDAGCTITNNGLSSGSILGTNCDVDATNNEGCSIATSNTETFGNGFNSENGGVYATEWTSSAISIWFFPRNSIPSDITAGTPNPANWGLALAEFSGGCDIDEHFMNQQIVFDTTFCGDWAGDVWTTDPVCSQKASTCVEYVMNNPTDFTNAYWSINSLQVFQDNGAAATAGSPTATSTSFVATATVTATNSLGSVTTSTLGTTLATSTSTSTFSIGATTSTSPFTNPFFTPSSTFSNTFFTSTPTSFTNSFFTSTPTSFTNTFFTPPTSTPTPFSNSFFTPPTSAPTSFSNTFFAPSSSWTDTWSAATSSWSTSWTQPTGTSSWSSWGGQGGNGGAHWRD